MTSIRPARAEDAAAIRTVTERAFAPQAGVGDLVEALAAGPARLSLVADDDATVIGHTMLSRGWIDARAALVETLILSPLSVDPSRQGQGIGGALVRAALVGGKQIGATAVFLEGSPDYYRRHGFAPAISRGFLRPSVRIPEAGFQVVLLPAWEDWMVGALVYPDAFWSTDMVGLRERTS